MPTRAECFINFSQQAWTHCRICELCNQAKKFGNTHVHPTPPKNNKWVACKTYLFFCIVQIFSSKRIYAISKTPFHQAVVHSKTVRRIEDSKPVSGRAPFWGLRGIWVFDPTHLSRTCIVSIACINCFCCSSGMAPNAWFKSISDVAVVPSCDRLGNEY